MKRFSLAAPALLAALAVLACATGRANIPYGLTPAELVQRAQEASDRNRPHQALQFYEALLERFPHEPAWVVNAEYEIAFIQYRHLRNFTEARQGLLAVLERYEAPGGEALPEKFRVLAHVVLERIGDRETRRRRGAAAAAEPAPHEEPEAPALGISAGIEDALAAAVESLSAGFPEGARVAVAYVTAESIGYAEFIAEWLESLLSWQGFDVAYRPRFAVIRAAPPPGFGGEIDDGAAAEIGYAEGASIAVTGAVAVDGAIRRLNLRAVDAETAEEIGAASEPF